MFLTDIVERRINKSQVVSGFLIANREDGCPLGRANAGATEEIEADWDTRYVEIRKHTTMCDRGAVRHVRYSALLAAMYRSLLIRRLAEQYTEPATGSSKLRLLIPCNLSFVASGTRVRRRIATKRPNAIAGRLQFSTAHRRHQRVTRRRG